MTEKENKEAIDTVAKFMGYRIEDKDGVTFYSIHDFHSHLVYFDSSWDWLMPVWVKAKIFAKEKNRDISYFSELMSYHAIDHTDIEMTFQTILKLIKELNEYKN